MIILARDTCLSTCSVAVLDDGHIVSARRESMARGHQERLAPMAQDVMAEARERAGSLPTYGSFDIDVLDPSMAPGTGTPEIGGVFTRDPLAELSQGRPFTLVGSGAALLADMAPQARIVAGEGCDAEKVARLAATRTSGPLKPLYLRAPDAKLPA